MDINTFRAKINIGNNKDLAKPPGIQFFVIIGMARYTPELLLNGQNGYAQVNVLCSRWCLNE